MSSSLCGTQQMYVKNTAIVTVGIVVAIFLLALFATIADTNKDQLKEQKIEVCAHAADVTNCLQRVR